MNNNQHFVSIGKAARYLGISVATLRRWHKAGTFRATFISPGKRLYYSLADLQHKTKGLVRTALDWARTSDPELPPREWYCPTSDVFKARLERMANELLTRPSSSAIAPLLTSAAGEIGNNSYDHNLGNWPDVIGTFFAYDLGKRVIVLADRGVGIFATLRRIRPTLATHVEALEVAFTQIVTGRAPEHRGNGLKYVRSAIRQSGATLRFWSGDASLILEKKSGNLPISAVDTSLRGCVAAIEF